MPSLARHGLLLMALAALALSVMSALAKFAAASLPSTEVVFFRSLLASLLLFGWHLGHLRAARQRFDWRSLLGRPASRPWLVGRGVLGALGLMLFFYALSGLSVADAMLLNACSPIWVLALGGPLLGEHARAVQWALVPVTLAGVVLVIRPDMQFVNWFGLAGFGSSAMAGGALVCVRRITRQEPAHLVVLYFAVASTLVSAPVLFAGYRAPEAVVWWALAGVGITSVVFQMLMTAAFRYDTAGRTAMALYLGPVMAAGWDALFWHHLPGLLTVGGAVLILGSLIALHRLGRAPHGRPGGDTSGGR